MAESSTNLKKTDNQIQEAQRVSNKMNPNEATTRHIINVKSQRQGENLKFNKTTCGIQGNPHKTISRYLTEIL